MSFSSLNQQRCSFFAPWIALPCLPKTRFLVGFDGMLSGLWKFNYLSDKKLNAFTECSFIHLVFEIRFVSKKKSK